MTLLKNMIVPSRSVKSRKCVVIVFFVMIVFMSFFKVFLLSSLLNNSKNVMNVIKLPRKSNVEEIRTFIEQHNRIEPILNLDLYGPLEKNSTVVLVQVHDRIMYLKLVIESFSKAKGIEEALLIFSHDVYDEEINKLVQNITFCKVLQIFYPYSIQTHPHEFPGLDPNDCTGHAVIAKARKMNCTNLNHHDHNGVYRNGNLTQMKHHWFWKLNQVFDHLRVTKHHTGLVLLIEDDHYIVEDFLHVLKVVQQKALGHPSYHFITLGVFNTIFDRYTYLNRIHVTSWMNNLGLAFSKTTWDILKVCKRNFCYYDDYNWDWTLQHVLQQCLNEELLSMILDHAPRAIHVGKCGQHIHDDACDPSELMKEISKMLDENRANGRLFPTDFDINVQPKRKNPSLTVGYGGWGDPREQELCMSMVKD